MPTKTLSFVLLNQQQMSNERQPEKKEKLYLQDVRDINKNYISFLIFFLAVFTISLPLFRLR